MGTTRVGYMKICVTYKNVGNTRCVRMDTKKLLGFLMVMFLALTVVVTTAGTVAADSDIANLTDEITDLFIDLIPLIVVLGIFGLIIAMVKIRGLK